MSWTREQYIAYARSIVFSSVKETILRDIKKQAFLKFLQLPFFNPIFNFFLDKLLNYLLDQTELRISYLYTDLRVSEQGKDFVRIVDLHNQGLASENDVINSFRTLIKFRL